jgi:hypothetical protein
MASCSSTHDLAKLIEFGDVELTIADGFWACLAK